MFIKQVTGVTCHKKIFFVTELDHLSLTIILLSPVRPENTRVDPEILDRAYFPELQGRKKSFKTLATG
jgi:hypothetical protein